MNESNLSLSQQYHKIEQQIRSRYDHRRRHPRDNSSQSSIQLPQGQPLPNDLVVQNSQLQAYIEQLCAYINESSSKYSRNVQTLSNSYRQIYLKLSEQQTKNDEERLSWKSQVTVERDLRLAREQEVDTLRKDVDRQRQLVVDREQKIDELKKEIQGRWEDTQRQKQLWTDILAKLEQQQNQQTQEINQHKLTIRNKEVDIEKLTSKMSELENELGSRMLMPDKIQNCEKKITHDEVVIMNLKQQLVKIEKERDFLKAEINKAQQQRQQFRIKNLKFEESFESFFTIKIKEYEDKWNEERRQSNTTIDRLKLQLENATIHIKKLDNEKTTLQDTLQGRNHELDHYKRDFEEERAQKQSYLNEFRQLKKTYENVINTLQEGFKAEQQKNWHLEDQKRDLEEQIDRFRELVKQIANINDFATAGTSQYYVRQISKLQETNPSRISREDYVLAREQATREVAAERMNEASKRGNASKKQINKLLDEQDNDTTDQWQKLLKGINSLKVPSNL